MSKTQPFVILSTGGTGGHIVPARALADDLLSRGFRVEVFTDIRGAKFSSLLNNLTVHIVKSGTIRPGLIGKINGIMQLGLGILQAGALLQKLKPDVVVGFGGYPSVPGVYAAQKQKIPTILHEQNAILGRANVFLADKAERIALSIPQTIGLEDYDKVRSVVTGNPVLSDISSLYTKPYAPPKEDGELRILIVGGSLGARVFSDIVPKALAGLDSAYKKRLRITQQCRAEDLDAAQTIYDDAGIHAELGTFFDDIPGKLEQTHLFIGRSGASTVAEITAAGRPAIFVPYPHHKDQQQKMNAEAVADAGGAWVMTENGFTQEALQAKIESFLQNPQNLFKAAENSRSCGRPDAARKLGNLVTALVSGWN